LKKINRKSVKLQIDTKSRNTSKFAFSIKSPGTVQTTGSCLDSANEIAKVFNALKKKKEPEKEPEKEEEIAPCSLKPEDAPPLEENKKLIRTRIKKYVDNLRVSLGRDKFVKAITHDEIKTFEN